MSSGIALSTLVLDCPIESPGSLTSTASSSPASTNTSTILNFNPTTNPNSTSTIQTATTTTTTTTTTPSINRSTSLLSSLPTNSATNSLGSTSVFDDMIGMDFGEDACYIDPPQTTVIMDNEQTYDQTGTPVFLDEIPEIDLNNTSSFSLNQQPPQPVNQQPFQQQPAQILAEEFQQTSSKRGRKTKNEKQKYKRKKHVTEEATEEHSTTTPIANPSPVPLNRFQTEEDEETEEPDSNEEINYKEENNDDDDDDDDEDEKKDDEVGVNGIEQHKVGGRMRNISGSTVNTIIEGFRNALIEKQDPIIARQQERYMKSTVKFYGLKTPLLRTVFADYYSSFMSSLPSHVQIFIAYKMMQSQFMEEKSASVMILVKNLRKLKEEHLLEIADLIDECVHEWSTCDSIAGKVMNLMLKRDNRLSTTISKWKESQSVWRLRCCCVSFVKLARFGKHNNLIIEICTTCIQRQDRFVQLGVGWLLRELSIANCELVVSFIKQNYDFFSREGLRYSIEKMDANLRKELLEFQRVQKAITKPLISSSTSTNTTTPKEKAIPQNQTLEQTPVMIFPATQNENHASSQFIQQKQQTQNPNLHADNTNILSSNASKFIQNSVPSSIPIQQQQQQQQIQIQIQPIRKNPRCKNKQIKPITLSPTTTPQPTSNLNTTTNVSNVVHKVPASLILSPLQQSPALMTTVPASAVLNSLQTSICCPSVLIQQQTDNQQSQNTNTNNNHTNHHQIQQHQQFLTTGFINVQSVVNGQIALSTSPTPKLSSATKQQPLNHHHNNNNNTTNNIVPSTTFQQQSPMKRHQNILLENGNIHSMQPYQQQLVHQLTVQQQIHAQHIQQQQEQQKQKMQQQQSQQNEISSSANANIARPTGVLFQNAVLHNE